MFKKKKKPPLEYIDVYPCNKKDCKFFAQWRLEKNRYGIPYIATERCKDWTFDGVFDYCVSCKHFIKLDCYKKKDE